MNQRYVTKYGNWNGWWNNHQLVETVTVHSYIDAIQYLADRNSGHDLYYTTTGEPVEGYLEEAYDEWLSMVGGGPLATDVSFRVFYSAIDWDLLIYWPETGHPVRVEFIFDSSAPRYDSESSESE